MSKQASELYVRKYDGRLCRRGPRRRNPLKGEVWQHFKHGDKVIIQGLAHDAAADTLVDGHFDMRVLHKHERDDPLFLPWDRSLHEFLEEVQDDQGVWVNRFILIQEAPAQFPPADPLREPEEG